MSPSKYMRKISCTWTRNPIPPKTTDLALTTTECQGCDAGSVDGAAKRTDELLDLEGSPTIE